MIIELVFFIRIACPLYDEYRCAYYMYCSVIVGQLAEYAYMYMYIQLVYIGSMWFHSLC